MDNDIVCWILDFLLRQPQVPDHTLSTLLSLLPLPPSNYPLTKSLLLRRISSEPSPSENILDLLEIAEELDRAAAAPAPASIQLAYRHVAVEVTARALGDAAEYFDVVKRVWRGRVSRMGEDCGLVSEDLIHWMGEIEAAVWDREARERVREGWREGEGMMAVRGYVKEAWEGLGPAFLDVVAEMVAVDGGVREVLEKGEEGSVDKGNEATVNDDTREVLGFGDEQVLRQHENVNKENIVSQDNTRVPRRKHVAKKRVRGSTVGTSRGAQITDTEQVENEEFSNKYGCVPLSAVDKLQEALRTSSLDLRAAVTDPLPEALELAENAITKENKDNRNTEILENEADPKRPCTSHQNNVLKPSLMARNTSAHTYEWDDSIDGSTDRDTGSRNRIKLSSPKNRVVSPLKKHEMKTIRGRRKKWTMLEEETLRTGVEKYGKGSWTAILNAYRDIFEDRTDVDLKDKWRNMTRYAH